MARCGQWPPCCTADMKHSITSETAPGRRRRSGAGRREAALGLSVYTALLAHNHTICLRISGCRPPATAEPGCCARNPVPPKAKNIHYLDLCGKMCNLCLKPTVVCSPTCPIRFPLCTRSNSRGWEQSGDRDRRVLARTEATGCFGEDPLPAKLFSPRPP